LGNPGAGGAGVVLKEGEEVVFKGGKPLGVVTNNVAEYQALIMGLEEAKRKKWEEVTIWSDSELLVRQLTGTYRVRDEKLRGLHERVKELLSFFRSWRIGHIPREENREADRLAKRAAKDGAGQVVAGPAGPEESPSSRGQDGR